MRSTLTLLLVLLLGSSLMAKVDAQLWQHYHVAEQCMERGQWQEARALADGLWKQASDPALRERLVQLQANLLTQQALECFNQNEFTQAQDLAQQALVLVPQYALAQALLNKLPQPSPALLKERQQFDMEQQIAQSWNPSTQPTPALAQTATQAKVPPTLLSIEWSSTPLHQAVKELNEWSQSIDNTAHSRVLLVHEKVDKEQKVTLTLRQVPWDTVLEYLARLKQLRVKRHGRFVVLESPTTQGQALEQREFFVRPQFFSTSPLIRENEETSVTPIRSLVTGDVREALVARGARFDQGSAAVYSPSSGVLTVLNTPEQLEWIEKLVLADVETQGSTKLVQIEARILEIAQNELEEIGVNWTVQDGVPFAGGYPSGQSGFRWNASTTSARTALGTAQSLPQNSLDNLIGTRPTEAGGQSISSNLLSVRGMLDGVGFEALLRALSQKKSANLMSSPSLVVNSGKQGTLEVVREFIYPIEWEAPRVALPSFTFAGDLSGISSTIPAWPSRFVDEPRKVGIRLRVLPIADATQQTILLKMKPQITDFDGFIDYGSEIRQVNVGQFTTASATNSIRVPVFTTRLFDGIDLEIPNGHTLVIGGLIREEVQTVEDRVPVLGDVPLLGKLFRSQVERATRKNTLLMVTPTLLGTSGN